MKRLIVAVALAGASLAAGDPAISQDAGKKAFLDVARVLQSPRCMNCHPSGDAPLQTDASRPHAMNVTRTSADSGLACTTCHRDRNSEALGIPGGPPGAPRWSLPAKEMPLIFQGMSPTGLCEQLKDPARNGHKTFEQLTEHVEHDPLVLWGWAPGGHRTLPPLSHGAFTQAFRTWLAAGAPCP